MKQTIVSILFIVATLSSLKSNAQKNENGKVFSAGFGIETGAIIGDKPFKEIFSSEFGVSARAAYKLGPGWITLTPGGTLVIPKSLDGEDLKVGTHAFVKAGYKYIFMEKLFVMGEVGYGSYTIYFDDGYDVLKSSSGGICFAPTVGANFGKFEIGVKFEYTKVEGGSVSSAGLRAGWNF